MILFVKRFFLQSFFHIFVYNFLIDCTSQYSLEKKKKKKKLVLLVKVYESYSS